MIRIDVACDVCCKTVQNEVAGPPLGPPYEIVNTTTVSEPVETTAPVKCVCDDCAAFDAAPNMEDVPEVDVEKLIAERAADLANMTPGQRLVIGMQQCPPMRDDMLAVFGEGIVDILNSLPPRDEGQVDWAKEVGARLLGM